MEEQFLHYIWKYQKFSKTVLSLTDGSSLVVFNTGNHNHDSGPDFEEASIKINNIQWAGHVEIHINASDWHKHNHQNDPAYKNVVLHVVWNYDTDVIIDGSPLPTLQLDGIVNSSIYSKYETHLSKTRSIPCSDSFHHVKSMTVYSMLNRTMIKRLEDKASQVLEYLESTGGDWEETTYRLLLLNFGFSLNKEPFRKLGVTLPFQKLKKILQNQLQTEAVLFGQAGFLKESDDSYRAMLSDEYRYLTKKHSLSEPLNTQEWKFGKMRPANFPTVRLAQLASLLYHNPKLFAQLIESKDIKKLKKTLTTDLSEYWQNHYDFGKSRKSPASTMGNQSFENILINTMTPLLAAYSKSIGDQQYMDRAIELLESLKEEDNRITRKWTNLGMKPSNAFDSQAIIELHNSFCKEKQCLSCNIGVEILNQ